jgi:DNA ligase-1
MIDTNDAFTRNDEGFLVHPTLYKLDSLGKLRGWRMERDGSRYRTCAGLIGGKFAVSGWTQARAASCASDEEQAIFEVKASYKHQLDREYHDNADSVDVPKMIEPMLAKTYTTFPGAGTFDPKFDGIRCIAVDAGLFSRQGQPITAVPHIHAALAQLFVNHPEAVIDGELYNHDLREDFGAISSIVRKKNPTAEQLATAEKVMQYHVYDLVTGTGDRWERKAQLAAMLDEANIPSDWIQIVIGERIRDELQLKQAYGKAIGDGYEGGIFAPDGYEYEVGRRSKGLLKMKEFITEEFQLEALLEGQGNWAGAAKTAVLRNGPEFADVVNPTFGKGKFGAGIRGSYGAGVQLLFDAHRITDKSTATVRYFMRSPDGVPRFPVVVDIQFGGRVD